MNQSKQLHMLVEELYVSGNPQADVWIDWAYPNHVLVVAENAKQLAERYKANVDQAVAGALLHDIADAVMARDDPNHEAESLRLARDLLDKAGFAAADAKIIVEEIIAPHSCRTTLPTTLEGKVMATADGMAHFVTDFYPYFCWQHYGPGDYADFKQWVLQKIEKDFTKKIFFEDVRTQIRPNYEALKLLFSL